MEITKQKIKISPLVWLGLGIIVGIIAYVSLTSSNVFGANPVANTAGEPLDLIGTTTGTTTVGVGFYEYGTKGTTTYPFRVGTDKKIVSLTLHTTDASTTAMATFQILSSNDYDCNTATTTTIYDVVTTSQINWYDASGHIRELAGSSSTINATTTTIQWHPTGANQNQQIILTDVNAKCLALRVNATSTVLSTQFITK